LNSISSVQQQHTKSVLTSISDFSLPSEVATIQQTDSTAHKLKPRLFHKSAQLQVHLVDFHPQYELCLTKQKIQEELNDEDNKKEDKK